MPVLIVTGGPLLAIMRAMRGGAYMAFVPMFLAICCFGVRAARVRQYRPPR